MREVFGTLVRVSRADLDVTLVGERGSGKEVLARAMHQQGRRNQGPWVTCHCPTLGYSEVAETELFGAEGLDAPTGLAPRPGAFERANTGTLFFDEVSELPLPLQRRVLWVLERGCVRRAGSTRDIFIDVRVVAATSWDLSSLVAEGKFHRDLYLRLAVALVSIPPLRERLEDLDLLTRRVLARSGWGDLGIDAEARELLFKHTWPGNVRELENVLTCALAFVDGSKLEARHLIRLLDPPEHEHLEQMPLAGHTLAELERAAIRQTLLKTRGVKVQAARALGIAVSTLYEKLKKYGLDDC